jgi:hypothetical protein
MRELAIAFKNVINTDERMVSVNQKLQENLIKAQEEIDKYEDQLKKAIEDKKKRKKQKNKFDKANMNARRAKNTMFYRKNDLFMARRTLMETKNVNHIPFFDAYTASIKSFVSAEEFRKSLERKLITLRTTTSDTPTDDDFNIPEID